VFENEKSLMATRFYPDVDFTTQLQAYVEENGGTAFFLNPDWKARLEEYTIALNGSLEVSGRSENESENYARIKAELEHSKFTLEKAIGRRVIMLCWPGGSGSKQGERALKELGYKLSTAARDLSYSERKALNNSPSQKSSRVARISPMTYHDNIADHGSVIIYSSGPIMVLKPLIFKNWLGARYWGNGILFLLQTFYKLVNR
jgi:hypothetical protein